MRSLKNGWACAGEAVGRRARFRWAGGGTERVPSHPARASLCHRGLSVARPAWLDSAAYGAQVLNRHDPEPIDEVPKYRWTPRVPDASSIPCECAPDSVVQFWQLISIKFEPS